MTISSSDLRKYLGYDPETGWFWWVKSDAEVRSIVGQRAGTTDKSGYRLIKFKSVRYREHILAVLYMTGWWPEHGCDHRDLNRSNNAWRNIRQATRSQNAANCRRRSHNRSGLKGAYLQSGKWRAQIRVNRRLKHLGYFTSAERAHAAYKAAAIEAFGDYARFG